MRISSDPHGERAGVQRQREDCHERAARLGWDVARVYEDNDLSAFSGKRRPAYQELLADIDNGAVNAIVIWHPDRLHRSPLELEHFIALIERTGVNIATCTAGDFDLATPEGRLFARITGSVARKESEDKSRRLKRYFIDASRRGVFHTGVRRYGMQPDGGHVPAEADMLRDAARRVLEGQTMQAICADLAATGITTPGGHPWQPGTLKRTLLNPSVGGYRAHFGELVARGQWEPVIDEAIWLLLCAEFLEPDRVTHGPYGHLLSGIITCAVCGRCLASRVIQRRSHYTCAIGTHVPLAVAVDVERAVIALLRDGAHLDIDRHDLVAARPALHATITRITISASRRVYPPNLSIKWKGRRADDTVTLG